MNCTMKVGNQRCGPKLVEVTDMDCTKCGANFELPQLEKAEWPVMTCPHCNCWPFARMPNLRSHRVFNRHGVLRHGWELHMVRRRR
jgi:DNA-directed RNA polymerase subunit RPC12/RpoP